MRLIISPFLWGSLILVLSQTIAFFVAFWEKAYFEAYQVVSPNVSLGPALAYFFGAVVLIGVVLFFVPLDKLRMFFRVLFALMLAWGALVVSAFTLPGYVPYVTAVVVGIIWFFWARIWLHDLLFMCALAAAGSVFGFLFSPWTFMAFMLVIALYDVLAVRFGFMLWMADRLSEVNAFPAFIFPRQISDWNLSLKRVRISDIKQEEPDKREYSILGGGDIGFPLMFSVSVFFSSGLTKGIVVAIFALLGLLGAYLIQLLWLKGKPVPALPPIACSCLISYLIVTLVF